MNLRFKSALIFSLLVIYLLQSKVYSQNLHPQRDSVSGLYGYATKNGVWKLAPRFESAAEFNSGRAIISIKGKFGLIDAAGRFLIKPTYENLEGDEFYFFRMSADSSGLVNAAGKVFLEGNFSHIYYNPERESALVMLGDKYGYWDLSGNYIAPFSSYELMFEDGLAYFNTGSSTGFVNLKGEKIVETSDGKISQLKGKGFIVTKDNGELFYNTKGKLVAEADKIIQVGNTWIVYKKQDAFVLVSMDSTKTETYQEFAPFNEAGISVAIKDSQYGIIDTSAKVLVPFSYQYIQPFGKSFNRYSGTYEVSHKYSLIKQDNKYGVLENNGNFLKEPIFTNAYLEDEILIREKDNKISITDLNTKMDIPVEDIFVFYQGKAIYFFGEKEERYGLINRKGEIALPANFNSIRSLSNGLFIAENEKGVGIIDTAGQMIVPCVYGQLRILNDLIYNRNPHNILFDNYVYAITKSGKTGVYGRNGQKVIDTIWNNISVYDDDGLNFFGQDKNNLWQIIDAQGKVSKAGLDEPIRFIEKRAVAKKKGHYGIVSNRGKAIAAFIFEQLEEQDNGTYIFKKDSRYGILSSAGKKITKANYTALSSFSGNIALAKNIEWGVITKDGIFQLGFASLKPVPDPYSEYENQIKKASLSFSGLSNLDELTIELFADSLPLSNLMNKTNSYILDQLSENFQQKTMLNYMPTVKSGTLKEKSSEEYIGKGVEIVNITETTVTLNFYTEKSGRGYSKVEDNQRVVAFDGQFFREIKLNELFSDKNYEQFLNEIIASKLRESDYRIFPSSTGKELFFDANLFQLDKNGLVLKVNEKIIDLTYNIVGPEVIIGYEEIESIVNKNGVMKEFYK